jgi:hypothetical protein
MSRSKTLAVSLIAVLAISGLAAAGAQALVFRAEKYPATLDGSSVAAEPTNFTFGEIEFTCGKTTLAGTLSKEDSTLLIQRSYSKCEMKFGEALVPATIKVNGCEFKLHLETKVNPDKYEASVDIVCPGGAKIEFYGYNSVASHEAGTPTCVFEIGAQNGAKAVYLLNMTEAEPTPWDLTVQPSAALKYKVLQGGEPCGPAAGTDIYSGNTTVTATDKGGKVIPIWAE